MVVYWYMPFMMVDMLLVGGGAASLVGLCSVAAAVVCWIPRSPPCQSFSSAAVKASKEATQGTRSADEVAWRRASDIFELKLSQLRVRRGGEAQGKRMKVNDINLPQDISRKTKCLNRPVCDGHVQLSPAAHHRYLIGRMLPKQLLQFNC